MSQKKLYNILREKGEATEFQILLEILRTQPHVKQKDIAEAVGITIQAVSKHFKNLRKKGLLETGSERADYRLTQKGTEAVDDHLKCLSRYVSKIKNYLKIERLLPALATQCVQESEAVGLIMKEGVLHTVSKEHPDAVAWGIATQRAQPGEDLGLRDLKGTVKTRSGKVVIVRLPSINEGGSRAADLLKIRRFHREFNPDRIGVVGVVGRAVLHKLGFRADMDFGITRAAALAAERGLNVFVLVVGRMVNRVIEEIDATNLKHNSKIVYEVKDGRTTME